jgi:hypothetical protein
VNEVCDTNGENRNVYRILLGRPEGNRPLGGPRHRLHDNIHIYSVEGCDRIRLFQDGRCWRVVSEHIRLVSRLRSYHSVCT